MIMEDFLRIAQDSTIQGHLINLEAGMNRIFPKGSFETTSTICRGEEIKLKWRSCSQTAKTRNPKSESQGWNIQAWKPIPENSRPKSQRQRTKNKESRPESQGKRVKTGGPRPKWQGQRAKPENSGPKSQGQRTKNKESRPESQGKWVKARASRPES